MNITLHGVVYLAFALCTLWGAASILAGVQTWVSDRFTFSGRRIVRRWDCSGARVTLPDGREAVVEDVYRYTVWTWSWGSIKPQSSATAPAMALVTPYSDDEQQVPEWVPVMSLAPYPAVAVVDAKQMTAP